MRAVGKGRFRGQADPVAQKFGRSVHFDRRLARHDLEGSRAHAAVLAKAGILSRQEVAAIRKGLDRIEREILQGKFRWKDSLKMSIAGQNHFSIAVPQGDQRPL